MSHKYIYSRRASDIQLASHPRGIDGQALINPQMKLASSPWNQAYPSRAQATLHPKNEGHLPYNSSMAWKLNGEYMHTVTEKLNAPKIQTAVFPEVNDARYLISPIRVVFRVSHEIESHLHILSR